MPLDDDVRAHLQARASAGAPAVWEVPVEEARQADRDAAAEVPRTPLSDVRQHAAPGPAGALPLRTYHPGGRGPAPLIVYLHGGGFVFGDLDTHDESCRRLAASSGAVVASVGYRRAPEHPFPAAVEDAEAGARWALSQARAWHADPARAVVFGDSAGGTLAAVAARRLRDAGLPLAGQVLIYPATDMTDAEHASRVACAEGYGLTAAAMRWFGQQYVGGPATEAARDPDASPLLAEDLSRLPPALVLTCEFDPLRDEGEAYARALEAAGVPVRCVRVPGTIHGIFTDTAGLRSADAAWASILEWLERTVGGPVRA